MLLAGSRGDMIERFAFSLPGQVAEAERVHPQFRGLECVASEFADVVKAVESGCRPEIRRQCLHLAVVACRLFLQAWEGEELAEEDGNV